MKEPQIGCVVIGRNEGKRLEKCLNSIVGLINPVVYVDSGSTDYSIEYSKGIGVDVLELNMSVPFTAARARNEGFYYLLEKYNCLDFILFVDGDCEILPGWVGSAVQFLDGNSEIAMVCGRLRERYPEDTIYNKLCDIEWDIPEGEVNACGGNAMARVVAFSAVNGFKKDLIAGEEPELCFRLRAQGWKIFRLNKDMALHDAAIKTFAQWWQRSIRAGYAFAEGSHLHGDSPEQYWVSESRRSWIWGIYIPATVFFLYLFSSIWFLGLLAVYPIQIFRIALRGQRTIRENWLYALFIVVGKFPEVIGQIRFHFSHLLNRRVKTIEYK